MGEPGLQPKVDRLNLALPLLAGDERFRPFADELHGLAAYSIFPDQLRGPQKYDPAKPMDRHGANWVSTLNDQPSDTWKPDLVAVLNRLTGDVVDVSVKKVASYLTVQFEHQREPNSRRKKIFESSQESDGTLRVAGMITALLQMPRPTVIAIEEPELTVHPGVLPLIKEYVEEASDRVQVVLTTHSPDLLQLLNADQLRVVERPRSPRAPQPRAPPPPMCVARPRHRDRAPRGPARESPGAGARSPSPATRASRRP